MPISHSTAKVNPASEEERRQRRISFGLEKNIARMHADLARYRVHFDEWFRESELHRSGYVKETMDILKSRGHMYEKDGATWFRATDFGLDKDEVMIKSNGFYTYYAVDIAYHRNKFEKRGFDRVINVFGADHHANAAFHGGRRCEGIDPMRLDLYSCSL
jgi:arginyl-tRNA synthetase